jgi:hypothetical protein
MLDWLWLYRVCSPHLCSLTLPVCDGAKNGVSTSPAPTGDSSFILAVCFWCACCCVVVRAFGCASCPPSAIAVLLGVQERDYREGNSFVCMTKVLAAETTERPGWHWNRSLHVTQQTQAI